MATNAWTGTSDSTSISYLWVNTGTTDSATTADWTFRVPAKPVHWEHRTDIVTHPTTTVPSIEVTPGGDIDAPDFEKRIKGEMMEMVQQYVNGLMPMLIDVLRNAPSMFGVEKKMTEGYFCFNCGSPIRRGKETEECAYCGK